MCALNITCTMVLLLTFAQFSRHTISPCIRNLSGGTQAEKFDSCINTAAEENFLYRFHENNSSGCCPTTARARTNSFFPSTKHRFSVYSQSVIIFLTLESHISNLISHYSCISSRNITFFCTPPSQIHKLSKRKSRDSNTFLTGE